MAEQKYCLPNCGRDKYKWEYFSKQQKTPSWFLYNNFLYNAENKENNPDLAMRHFEDWTTLQVILIINNILVKKDPRERKNYTCAVITIISEKLFIFVL